MMELSQPGPRRVYCVQDTYPKWSNTTDLCDMSYDLVFSKLPKRVRQEIAGE